MGPSLATAAARAVRGTMCHSHGWPLVDVLGSARLARARRPRLIRTFTLRDEDPLWRVIR